MLSSTKHSRKVFPIKGDLSNLRSPFLERSKIDRRRRASGTSNIETPTEDSGKDSHRPYIHWHPVLEPHMHPTRNGNYLLWTWANGFVGDVVVIVVVIIVVVVHISCFRTWTTSWIIRCSLFSGILSNSTGSSARGVGPRTLSKTRCTVRTDRRALSYYGRSAEIHNWFMVMVAVAVAVFLVV